MNRRFGFGCALAGTGLLLTIPVLFNAPALAEAGMHRLAPDVSIPDLLGSPACVQPSFPSFNSQRLDQQVRLYASYLARYGTPDILIVGSSRALQGVDPVVLQQALSLRGLPLRIYNFSINGATAHVVDLMLRRVLASDQLPRLIIWADGSRAFNSARPDLTYTSIAASQGYRQLALGDRPIVQLTSETAVAAIQPCSDELPDKTTTVAYQLPPSIDLNAYGFQSVAAEFDPVTYYRRFPRVPGRYDDNYTPFRLEGVQTESTLAIARFARDHQIPLVFVSLPLSNEHLNDPVRRRAEQQFRRYMQQLSRSHGFLFEDLSQQWGNRHHYFADPSHLNRQGAEAVAQHLGTVAALPWFIWFSGNSSPQSAGAN